MIAVLSDIHGNLEALSAVLEDCLAHNVERVFFLGDFVGYGPSPREILDIAIPFGFCLRGNHEQAILEGIPRTFHHQAARSLEWTRETVLGADGESRRFRAFLSALPTHVEADGLFFCHDAPQCPGRSEYLVCADSARKAFESSEFQTCFVGHTHRPGIWYADGSMVYPESDREYAFRGRQIIDVGSVGQPRDGDPRACYALVDRGVTIRRLRYDVARTMVRIVDAGLDEELALRLERGL